jgi:hypothetical protein
VVYATPTDLTGPPWNYSGDDAETLLARASAVVDRMLIGAIYDVDSDEMPTDAKVIVALRDATCIQALFSGEIGDPSGALGRFSSFSIGSISAARAAGANGAQVDTRYSDDARDILRVAGLIPGNVASFGARSGRW